MGRKRYDSSYAGAVSIWQTYNYYMQRLKAIAVSCFDWDGLPPGVRQRNLELSLLRKGACLFYRDENTGHLKYIAFDGAITDSDFNILDSESVDLDLGLDCYHPEVSPDGKWVAFSTSHENSGAQSDLYVKRIGSPYPPQKLNAMSAAIPRWRVLPNGDTVIVYVDDTTVLPSKGMESDSEIQMRLKAWKETGTWMVPF